jgi:riboflavin synthase
MFTGLVQSLAAVETVAPDGVGGARLSVVAPAVAAAGVLGESIAVNGVCLTLVAADGGSVAFECGPETLVRTNLGRLGVGSHVNLERALRMGDAVGGHFVTGHVDCVGTIAAVEPNGEWVTIHFAVPKEFDDLLVIKGSVAIDGISLTLVSVEPGKLSVMLIPHTLAHTTLGLKTVGDEVNVEFDLLAKHVKKLFTQLTITL